MLDNSTYDTFFIGGSTGMATLDGGNYVVNVAEAVAVPEPGSLAFLGCLIPIWFLCRRRRMQASN
ncbi:MAG: PEP-CTERM sorting domain-containing protein [Planctomycetaceae bacterium]